MGRYADAVAELKKTEGLFSQYDAKDIKTDISRLLYQYYTAMGDSVMATHYHLLYFCQKDSLLNASKLAGLQEFKFHQELDNAKSEILLMAQKARTQRIITMTALVVALIILTMLVLLRHNYRIIRAKNQVLYQKSQETLAAVRLPEVKYSNSPLDATMKTELMQRVQNVMSDTDVICQPDFSITQLAERTGAKQRYVSQVINEHYDQGFNQMLSEYRIREACRRLSDTAHYGHYTTGGLAESLGIKSRSNFVSNFKRIVGMSPSEYKNQIRQG